MKEFRQAMRRHIAGVCVVSVGSGDDVNGMTVTACTSFSMDPPSVLVCVNTAASVTDRLLAGSFRLTLLGRRHEAVADAFSRKPIGRSRFADPRWRFETLEEPWLEDAPANLSCVTEDTIRYGSHIAIIGRVRSVSLGPDGPGLAYREGRYQ